jgi:hypothetical protein
LKVSSFSGFIKSDGGIFMEIDLIQVATNLIVGAVSAWVAGRFGVHYGLEQAKRQRAFDRRLEWYEKAVRSLRSFSTSSWKLVNGLAFDKPEEVANLLSRLEQTAGELDASLEESVLFADRQLVIRLRDYLSYLEELIVRIRDVTVGKEKLSDISDVADMARALLKDFRGVEFSLACTVRKELKLDDISRDDLKTEEQRMAEEDQRAVGQAT